MNLESYALKKNGCAEGTHSNISSSLFDILFIQTNDAYRNLLRRRILEGLKIRKGAVKCRPPFAPYHLPISSDPNTLSELSKPDERIL
jgi:hypothetical protein